MNARIPQNSEIVEISTTVGNETDANNLARKLVESKLAACVQITGPIHSVYRWKGEICEEHEWRCTIKSLFNLVESVQACIRQYHPYETPEVLVLSVVVSSPAYELWVREQVAAEPKFP